MIFLICANTADLWYWSDVLKSSQYSNETLSLCFFPPTLSLCKGRTLYSVVRDAKVVLDVNKTRQIAQEMVKVKRLNTASSEHFCRTHHLTKTSHISPHRVLREWATSTQRGFYTRTWSPRTCFMTTAKLSSPTSDSSPYLGFCRLAGNYCQYTSEEGLSFSSRHHCNSIDTYCAGTQNIGEMANAKGR